MTDLTCIITGHREGRLSVASLRSFRIAIDEARKAGISCQALYVLDTPNELTRQLFTRFCSEIDSDSSLIEVELGDQGKARNMSIRQAKGRLTAFLDADDLWSRDWLARGVKFLEPLPETHIAHPEFNYFFEKQTAIYTHIDQESPEFDRDLLRFANYWDALAICPTEIYREFPFYPREIDKGWAYEDWYWNCQTVDAGKVHKVVPDTVLFKRRQQQSQTIRASANKSMIRPTPLHRYNHAFFGAEALS